MHLSYDGYPAEAWDELPPYINEEAFDLALHTFVPLTFKCDDVLENVLFFKGLFCLGRRASRFK